MKLPLECLECLQGGDVLEAFLCCDPGYMSLWPLGDIARLNEDYNVAAFAPGFLCFGSNGGGELLALDAVGRICHLPAIGMDAKCAIRIADSGLEFERFIQEPA